MLYDYRSEDEVQYEVIDDISEIISDIIKVYATLRRGEFMTVYAPYDMVYEIADYLMNNQEMYLDEESDAIDGQPKIEDTLLTIDSDGDLFVEEARLPDGKLKRSMATLDYVYDGFKQSDVEYLSFTDDYILVFGFNDESTNDKVTACMSDLQPMEDVLHGFEISKTTDNGYCSYSFYTTEDLPVEVMQSIADILK